MIQIIIQTNPDKIQTLSLMNVMTIMYYMILNHQVGNSRLDDSWKVWGSGHRRFFEIFPSIYVFKDQKKIKGAERFWRTLRTEVGKKHISHPNKWPSRNLLLRKVFLKRWEASICMVPAPLPCRHTAHCVGLFVLGSGPFPGGFCVVALTRYASLPGGLAFRVLRWVFGCFVFFGCLLLMCFQYALSTRLYSISFLNSFPMLSLLLHQCKGPSHWA